MNIDEREWDDQERALESIRSGNLVGHESRMKQYRFLWRVLARQPIPALSDDFTSRVALLANIQCDEIQRIDRRFERRLAAGMLATLVLVAGLISVCFGIDWLKPLLAANPWLEASLVCFAILAGSRSLHSHR
jgi:hypothetical protein